MRGRLVAGLVLVIVGLAFLIDAAGVAEVGDLVRTYWPVLLIVLGIVHLVTHRSQPLGGLVMLGLGVWFLTDELGYLPEGAFRYVWPAGLIVLGLWFILSRPRGARSRPGKDADVGQEDTLQRSVVFGGIDERVRSERFRGGRIEVTFGGAKVDLREARLASEGARLDLSATFGGIELVVPPSWAVRVEGRPLLGGVENKTRPPTGAAATLDIRAAATFGGVTIRN